MVLETEIWTYNTTGIHNLNNKSLDYLAKKKIHGVWNNISSTKRVIESMGLRFNGIFKQSVKSGDNTQFWNDVWTGAQKMKVIHSSLYEPEEHKSCLVAFWIQDGRNNWNWKSCVVDAGLSTDMDRLIRAIEPSWLQPSLDHLSCQLASDGKYKVELLQNKIEHSPTSSSS